MSLDHGAVNGTVKADIGVGFPRAAKAISS
jgi:hypothetical protein